MRTLDVIEVQCGARPPMCPWRSFSHPVVRDVLDLYHVAYTGEGIHLASVRALNPPHHLWHGVQFYAHALRKCREAIEKTKQQANKGR